MFEKMGEGLYLLKVPFADAYTGVTLVIGEEKVLIDTACNEHDVKDVIVPALKELGLTLNDIDWLTNTHSHGDHIGGYETVKALCPTIKVAASETDYINVEDPASLAIKIRGRYPKYSPAPQSFLKGVKVDKILKDGEMLGDRLKLITTPGHDEGCVCFYDLKTKTIISGDSIQGNGATTQGVGFYQTLDGYRSSMKKLLELDAENILCGHHYDMIGSSIVGKENVKKALNLCLELTDKYQAYVDEKLNAGISDPGEIAKSMVIDIGCGMPPMLFMAVYTVCQHIEKHI